MEVTTDTDLTVSQKETLTSEPTHLIYSDFQYPYGHVVFSMFALAF